MHKLEILNQNFTNNYDIGINVDILTYIGQKMPKL
jgi:hypothetical protein